MSALPRQLLLATEASPLRTVVIAPVPGRCACGQMAIILVNRAGRTRCMKCDLDFEIDGTSAADQLLAADSLVKHAFADLEKHVAAHPGAVERKEVDWLSPPCAMFARDLSLLHPKTREAIERGLREAPYLFAPEDRKE